MHFIHCSLKMIVQLLDALGMVNGTRDYEIVPASKIAINVSPGTRNERQG